VDVEDLTIPNSLSSKQQTATLKTWPEKQLALVKLGLAHTSSVTPLLSPLQNPLVTLPLPSLPLFQIPRITLQILQSLDFTKHPFTFSWIPTFQPGHCLPGFSYQTNQKSLHIFRYVCSALPGHSYLFSHHTSIRLPQNSFRSLRRISFQNFPKWPSNFRFPSIHRLALLAVPPVSLMF
jgi:hypothetical protein